MQNIWFITNPGSGSTAPAKVDALLALVAEQGWRLAGHSQFPADPLPNAGRLTAAGVDTVILFAGDGTINAAISALADWGGAFLLLPGGTMNLLAKTLHGEADPASIVKTGCKRATLVALPFVEAGPHRAYVGLILGPAASWVHARERVRAGRLRGLGRAIAHAWARTFGRGIRLGGAAGLPPGVQAVLISPDPSQLRLAAVNARDWRSIARLGWDWLSGDWMADAAVTQVYASTVSVLGDRPVLALFDGEPHQLAPGLRITGGMTRRQFVSTLSPA
ncbi:diacylglycerol kinase family protein [Sphingomonas sp. 28-63-12]|uniref:diacylglycerol/lipid kinase family protein n=1 Tax=Sphingomonas sp. 28-63-12 TaxID=1970434 RepID=UPI000BD0A038|nr:MAG: hypothetical protein B7Y47_13515 [Sphingomonas sp. 28-63-12]